MIKVSVMYPNTPGARFDHAYYKDKHMPLLKTRMAMRANPIRSTRGSRVEPLARQRPMSACVTSSATRSRRSRKPLGRTPGDHGRHQELYRPRSGHADQRSRRRLTRCFVGWAKARKRRAHQSQAALEWWARFALPTLQFYDFSKPCIWRRYKGSRERAPCHIQLNRGLFGRFARTVAEALMPKITIVETGVISPKTRARHGSFPQMFERMISEADASASFATVRLMDGEALPDRKP